MKYAIFDTHGNDSALNHRSGEKVKIIRALTEKEADIFETGPMYKIQFSDGYTTDAFIDELKTIK